MTTVELAHVLIALGLLTVLAHAGAQIFQLLRQPPVIGEIVGGLVLGPTVLGALWPTAETWLFPAKGATGEVLGAFYSIGMLLLVYLTGAELRGHVARSDRRTMVWVAGAGLFVPFAAGLLVANSVSLPGLSGPHGNPASLALVFGMAIAVTSVPVISRIMLDLGILRTVFARVVLAVAVLEDVVLYALLAVVLGIAQARAGDSYGVGGALSRVSLPWAVVFFSLVPVVFFGLFLWRGRAAFDALRSGRWNVLERRSPTAFRIAYLFALCLACSGLGIDPMFGALAAGLSAGGPVPGEERAAPAVPEAAADAAPGSYQTLRAISLAFFVPVYFAVVGLKLDLIRHFDPVFFLWFLALACVVKSAGVWAGARLAGQDAASAGNIAVAMNARGGPGIILASVTYAAGVISEDFFTSLVVLSIVTSQAAGVWLGRTVRRHRPLMSQRRPTGGERGTPDPETTRRKAETA
nr:cation:proton antiporter [Streptomyces sp. SID5468]